MRAIPVLPHREHVLNHSLLTVEAFPERDNEKKRVFEAVKMSVCVVTLLAGQKSGAQFSLRIHKDKFVDPANEKAFLTLPTPFRRSTAPTTRFLS